VAEERRSEQPGQRDPERIAHFRIVERIGRGGMGIVYRAQDEKLGRPVALKVLAPGFEQDRDRRSRFIREARAAAAVAHPNIATIHEIGEDDGRVFIAMELVEGVTLRAMLEKGPLPPANVVRIGLQVARALAKAHAAGVVHRDLKPDNVMVGEDLHAKVLDFGLAKVTGPGASAVETPSAIERGETATREGVLLGTPQYMSPEQAKGRPIDARSDVFSLGIVLYEMVAGRRPFDGVSVAEVIIAIDRDPPPPLTSIVGTLPAGLVRVIDRCLEKDAARRYADGKGVADDLATIGSESGAGFAAPATAPPTAPAPAPTPTVPMSIATPGPAQVGPAPRPKRRVLRYVILAFVVLALLKPFRTGCAGGSGGKGGSSHAPTTGSSTLPPQAASIVAAAMKLASSGGPLLACPPLVAKGVEEPSGWLGAAAANVACRRAAILAGGSLDRVVVPAELLDLPRQPTDDFPRDPYGAPGARDRAVSAAHNRAAMWLDGSVEKTAGGFKVALTLRSHDDDDEIESAEGSGHHVYLAVRDAMHHLVQEEAISHATHVDDDIAKWTGIKDVDLALAWDDWHDSLASAASSTATELARLQARRVDLGALWPQAQYESQLPLLVETDHFDPVSLDRSSPAAFARTAVAYGQTVRAADCASLAAEARKLRDAEPSATGRRSLLLAQAQLTLQAGDLKSALELALGEAREEPRSDHTWEIPLLAAQGQRSLGPIARAMAAWMPEDHASYNAIATGDAALPDVAARLPFARRAYEMSPDFPMWGATLGKELVELGRREEARSVATSMLAVGPLLDPAGQAILVSVDASEAHFGAAVARGTRALDRVARFGEQVGDWYLIDALLGASAVGGGGTALGDDFANRFVLADPPRLGHGDYFGGPLVLAAADACAVASRDTARRCFARLRQLLASHYFPTAEPTAGAYIDGCDGFAQGDLRGAAAAWRPLVAGHEADAGYAGNAVARFGPAAFEAAGDHDLAARIDARNLASGFDAFAGASPAMAREARRDMTHGDKSKARELAQKLVDAWGASDVPVPAVADMKALLKAP